MKGKVARGNRITEGSIFGRLLPFFFPILFGTFLQQLHNTADAMVVGRFAGKWALAAVGGSTSTLISLLVGFFVGLSSSATVIISQFYGARKTDKVHWAVYTSIVFSVIGGIIFMIAGLVGSPRVLEAIKTPEDIMGHTVVYIRIYFPGTIVNLVYNVGAGILQAVGDPRRPLYLLIASCFTNIILDVLLVTMLRVGVAGAALATITSQLLSAALVVRALTKTDGMYKLEWKKVHIDRRVLQRIVCIDVPVGMQSVMYNTSNVVIQAGINTLETDNATTWATYGKMGGLYWMVINTLGVSTTTFVGQDFGAGRLDRVHKGAGACMVIGVVLAVSARTVLHNGGHLLVKLPTTNLQVQATSTDLLHFMVPTSITYITIEILSGTLRGAGDAWMPLVITGIGVYAVKVLWTVLVLPHYHAIIGTAFYYPLAWSLTTVAFVIYYYFFSNLRRWKLKPLRKRSGVYRPFWCGKTFCVEWQEVPV